VQLAEAIPVAGSGLKLPLNLHAIGARCSNAYFAPKRFAAVQLAFSNPRCRVLVFRKRRPSPNPPPSF
jgi:TATA-box binding protein (TBP) (component of TFIID and TFIIIB)